MDSQLTVSFYKTMPKIEEPVGAKSLYGILDFFSGGEIMHLTNIFLH